VRGKAESPKVSKAEEKYLKLREKVKPELVAVYDECAAIMCGHSRQPRKAKDFRGMANDLRAVLTLADKTRDIVEHLPAALRAVFVDRWEEMQYFTTGKVRIETISGLVTVWPDGTLKAVALVNRYQGCREEYEGSAKEREDELRMLKAEYRELQKLPGDTTKELAVVRAKIAELTGGQR